MLSYRGAFYQLSCVLSGFLRPDFPADNVAAEQVAYHVEVVEQAPGRAVQIGDVPHPYLIGCRSDVRAYLALYRSR